MSKEDGFPSDVGIDKTMGLSKQFLKSGDRISLLGGPMLPFDVFSSLRKGHRVDLCPCVLQI